MDLSFPGIFWAAGFITLMILIMVPAFRPREIFTGTARDLADYLENVDISTPDGLTIHRVAVVHPLDPEQVFTCTKRELFLAITGEGAETGGDPTPGDLS